MFENDLWRMAFIIMVFLKMPLKILTFFDSGILESGILESGIKEIDIL